VQLEPGGDLKQRDARDQVAVDGEASGKVFPDGRGEEGENCRMPSS
jgi:hypothetical protein